MTFDDLVKVYESHGIKVSAPDLRNVILALRNDLLTKMEERTSLIDDEDVNDWFISILGFDTDFGEIEPMSDPRLETAETVYCLWTPRQNEPGFYGTPHGIKYRALQWSSCPACKKLIRIEGSIR